MSVEHLACVLHHSKAKGTAKLVLLGIANHEGDGGAWPSVAKLAVYAGVDERQVRKCIARLVSSGELWRDVQGGGLAAHEDHRRPNLYRVLVQCPGWCDRTPNHRDTRKLAGPQPGLWTKGPDPLSSRTPPVPQDRGTPVLQDPLTITTNRPPHQAVSQSQTAREACDICSQPELRCQQLQAKWLPEHRHSYTPKARP